MARPILGLTSPTPSTKRESTPSPSPSPTRPVRSARSHTFYEKGVYPVTLTVTDSTGAVGAITHNVEALNHAPHAEFRVWPYIPQRLIATKFDASGSYDEDGYIVEWLWSFGDGATSNGEVVQHTYELSGSYTVRLTVIDDNGKSSPVTKIIKIGGCNTCGN